MKCVVCHRKIDLREGATMRGDGLACKPCMSKIELETIGLREWRKRQKKARKS